MIEALYLAFNLSWGFYNFFFLKLFLAMSMHECYVIANAVPREDVKSSGAGVTVGCDPPCAGARNQMLVLCRRAKHSSPLRNIPSPYI